MDLIKNQKDEYAKLEREHRILSLNIPVFFNYGFLSKHKFLENPPAAWPSQPRGQ